MRRGRVVFFVLLAGTTFAALAIAEPEGANAPTAQARGASTPWETSKVAQARTPTKPRGGLTKPKKAAPAKKTTRDAGVDTDAIAPMEGRGESMPATPAPATTSNPASGAVETKTLDGGARVFRFGELEIEGRLRTPQLVYFLRRVRAEFAAGDLGHRTFMRELSETRQDPNF